MKTKYPLNPQYYLSNHERDIIRSRVGTYFPRGFAGPERPGRIVELLEVAAGREVYIDGQTYLIDNGHEVLVLDEGVRVLDACRALRIAEAEEWAK